MAYTNWDVVFGEQPTAAKWNELGDNDAFLYSAAKTGWFDAEGSWTYNATTTHNGGSGQNTTYSGVINIPAGGASKYSAGMRVRFSQTTGGTKYGIITKVTDTTLTVFFGTDYTLVNEAITSPHFSTWKAPLDFPLSPAKWTIQYESAADVSGTATNGWSNPTGHSIQVPIGSWDLGYLGSLYIDNNTAAGTMSVAALSTLSTANNTESDDDFTQEIFLRNTATGQARISIGTPVFKNKTVDLAADTIYYLNVNPQATVNGIQMRGAASTTFIRAVSAYL